MLYQFLPHTREVVQLAVPAEPWPVHSNLLVDHSGRLWLGAIGYREQNGTWHRLHPNPAEYFKHAGDVYWASPKLWLESSDGVLWYSKDLDGDLRAEGSGWYDPGAGQGCLFTNLAMSVIEDPENNLWMAVDERLYTLQITPRN